MSQDLQRSVVAGRSPVARSAAAPAAPRGGRRGALSRPRVPAVLAALSAALLGGCAMFGTELDPVATYALLPPESFSVAWGGERCCVLEVRTPLPAPGFATARMLYQRSPYRNEAFAYAEWVDTLPSMLRSALVDALDEVGRFEMVVAAPSPETPQYRLESRDLMVVQRFDGTDSEVLISVRVRLVDVANRSLLGASRFEVTVPADPDPVGGVAAANEALADLLGQIARYVLAQLEA